MPHIEKIQLPDGTLADVGLLYKEDTEIPIVVDITDATVDKVELTAFGFTAYKISDRYLTTKELRNSSLSRLEDGSEVVESCVSSETLSALLTSFLVDNSVLNSFYSAVQLPGVCSVYTGSEIPDGVILSFEEAGTFTDSIHSLSITVPSVGTYMIVPSSVNVEDGAKILLHTYSVLPNEYLNGSNSVYTLYSMSFNSILLTAIDTGVLQTLRLSAEDTQELVNAVNSNKAVVLAGPTGTLVVSGVTASTLDDSYLFRSAASLTTGYCDIDIMFYPSSKVLHLNVQRINNKPVTINVDDAYSWNLMSSWQSAYMASGGTVTSTVLHPENISDFIAEVQDAVDHKERLQIAFNYANGEYFVTNAVTLMRASNGSIINVGAHFTEYNASLGGMFSIDVLVGNTENCDGVFINATIVPITDTPAS